MSVRLANFRKSEDGGAVLEVALALPLLLLVLLGTMQMGIALFGYCSASFAARTAVRFASVHSSTSLAPATTASVQASVQPYLWMGSQVSQPTITPSWPNGNTVGNSVSVSVSVVYKVLLPFTSLKQLTLNTTSARTIVR